MADSRGPHAPWAAGLVDVENAIEDAAELQGLPPRSTGTPLGLGQPELEEVPLRITDICGIVTYGAQRRDSFSSPCTDLGQGFKTASYRAAL